MAPRGALLLVLCALAGGSCARREEAPRIEHAPVVRDRLERLERELVAARPPAQPPADLDPEHAPGLVHMLATSGGRERSLVLEEARALGEALVPALAAIAADSERAPAERVAACELLEATGTASSAAVLIELVEKAPETWMRAQCAWRLRGTGRDEFVPRLLLRLKYEREAEPALWVASALGDFRNYAGLAKLWSLSAEAPVEELRTAAAGQLARLASEAGVGDAAEHYRLWHAGDPLGRLPRHEPSLALQVELWRWIAALAEYQLRGVDDARFVLSNLGSYAVQPLCDALRDLSPHVRVHAAQCLERMGPRAVSAGAELVHALDDPSIAADAAAALGAIGYPAAERALRARLAPTQAHELRVACAKALGRLALPESRAELEHLLDPAEPLDLRQACAEALVGVGAGERAVPLLHRLLRAPEADRFGAEAALERWLRSLDAALARETLGAWLARAPEAGRIPSPEEAGARLEARAELLDAALPRLIGEPGG